jgi:hypothetical protein
MQKAQEKTPSLADWCVSPGLLSRRVAGLSLTKIYEFSIGQLASLGPAFERLPFKLCCFAQNGTLEASNY